MGGFVGIHRGIPAFEGLCKELGYSGVRRLGRLDTLSAKASSLG